MPGAVEIATNLESFIQTKEFWMLAVYFSIHTGIDACLIYALFKCQHKKSKLEEKQKKAKKK